MVMALNSGLMNESRGDKVFNFVNYTFLILFTTVVLYPILYVLSASFSNPMAIMAGKVWLYPVDFTLEGYKAVLSYQRVWIGFGNSLFYATIGTMVNVVVTIMAAYPLSRKDFAGGSIIMLLFVFTMWFRGGLIPDYLLVKSLNLLDTRWAMIVPKAMEVYFVILARTYFQTQIPEELLESARLDGCDDYKFLWNIVIPLSGSILAVITLFYAVKHWNSFFDAFIFLSNRNYFPIQLILREVLTMNKVDSMMAVMDATTDEKNQYMAELLKYSLIIISSIPVIIAYPFAQKYFVKGVMIGAIKG
jgi:putative aldouronate transport system permease protein